MFAALCTKRKSTKIWHFFPFFRMPQKIVLWIRNLCLHKKYLHKMARTTCSIWQILLFVDLVDLKINQRSQRFTFIAFIKSIRTTYPINQYTKCTLINRFTRPFSLLNILLLTFRPLIGIVPRGWITRCGNYNTANVTIPYLHQNSFNPIIRHTTDTLFYLDQYDTFDT